MLRGLLVVRLAREHHAQVLDRALGQVEPPARDGASQVGLGVPYRGKQTT